ncbi:hypothetical protein [Kineococcus rubinsiae]|uniref:hypothetical protein n=1 Tax=Kineococcus rubinsiae TaxID=2609562 RepID=UPI001430D1D9|nr:hypothetical protein [Kineococcus rubinsiae]NIZ89988.1 hypothetical protein [Kineococcus rubinsiae]
MTVPRTVARAALVVAAVSTLALLAAACGQPASDPRRAAPPVTAADPDPGPFEVSGFVLEDDSHGPQLCLGAIAMSSPPQCGGPDLLGWDFASLPAGSYDEAAGARFGPFVVTGVLEGGAVRLTAPARPGRLEPADVVPERSFASPCPPPAGGWTAPDPARTSEEALQAASVRAEQVAGYGELWIDQLVDEVDLTGDLAGDPLPFVLDVSTAGDLAAMEAAVREVWGGALCVSAVPRSAAELTALRDRLDGPSARPGTVQVDVDVPAGQVVVTVLLAGADDQRRLDEEFGPGFVRLLGLARPLGG